MELEKIRSARVRGIMLLFICLLGIALIINISWGSIKIDVQEIIAVLKGQSENVVHNSVIWKIRLPRTLAALLGGAALAVAGLLLQVFFRNPIVEPFVLGISSGATLMVGLVILAGFSFGMESISPYLIIVSALAGAILVMCIVLLLSLKVRSIVTLLVIGLMVGYSCSAVTSILTALADRDRVHGFVIWSMGSFSNYTWDQVAIVAAVIIPFLAATFLICKPLNAFLMGEEYAKSMGVNIKLFRFVVVALASVLAAIVTAFTGPVSFIGMAIPHICRILFQAADNRILIPGTILGGAVITSLCDLAARMLISPIELPISAITSIFGAPIIVFMLLKRRTDMQ